MAAAPACASRRRRPRDSGAAHGVDAERRSTAAPEPAIAAPARATNPPASRDRTPPGGAISRHVTHAATAAGASKRTPNAHLEAGAAAASRIATPARTIRVWSVAKASQALTDRPG